MKPSTLLRFILPCFAFSVIPAANAATATATFQVLITILKSCSVTAGASSNINLGSVNANATNTSGNSTISVNCSKTTPYFIGLAPSTANGGGTGGAGAMSSVANAATNTDKVPYQLNQTSATGPVWGTPRPRPRWVMAWQALVQALHKPTQSMRPLRAQTSHLIAMQTR